MGSSSQLLRFSLFSYAFFLIFFVFSFNIFDAKMYFHLHEICKVFQVVHEFNEDFILNDIMFFALSNLISTIVQI